MDFTVSRATAPSTDRAPLNLSPRYERVTEGFSTLLDHGARNGFCSAREHRFIVMPEPPRLSRRPGYVSTASSAEAVWR
jgi:hypothetical protein